MSYKTKSCHIYFFLGGERVRGVTKGQPTISFGDNIPKIPFALPAIYSVWRGNTENHFAG